MSGQALVEISSHGKGAGFSLAGVRVIQAADGQAAGRELERLVNEAAAGVVIIEEPLYQDLTEELRTGLARVATPVVIPVPGPAWTAESTAHEYIGEILRRAIGYRVRLQ